MKLEQVGMPQTSKSRRPRRVAGSPARSSHTGNWKVDNIRVSVFGPNIADLSLPSWQALTGIPPQIVSSNSPAGIKQEAGPLPQNPLLQLGLLEQPGRADLVLNPVIHASTTARVFDIGTMEAAVSALTAISAQWLPAAHDVTRLAIGATLMWESSTVADAQAVLFRYIPAFAPHGTIEEFKLHLNRPRISSAIPGLKINRLLQWSTAMVGSVPVFYSSGFGGGPVTPFSGIPIALCVADINTDPTGAIKGAQISDLFAEMRTFLLEIEMNGDVA